ncbi:MAG: hypothetical protein A2945_01570 [Candidatus Liptonbacteria bacterium RIFCSPLOWO2_01_FULL_52_25]|uniref:ABC3 transporter permease protein domain-containing protein n=1 Tax=Candidatus Liptonbacteria bacterium RIFCSPLOWO2_01_FULL_52_25 TaxID=1798650 RepID=A0A1G2CDQ8_9BACT|nr:MAG: hypothetical protein A2945_01570 [Candidatus Liptonbacteria bacterium RIFCSPLOWO2_01_FULL_52_25]
MRAQDVVKLSTRMFKTNPARTWLTILGMGVGTSAVVLLVGLGFGLQGVLLEKIILGDTLLSLTVQNPSSGNLRLTDEALQKFKTIPDVVDVSPLANLSALMTLDDVTGNVVLQGVHPSYFRYAGTIATEGELFSDKDAPEEIVFSQTTLKLFQIEDSKSVIGKKVKLRVSIKNPATGEVQEISLNKEYRVKGVTNEAGAITVTMSLADLLAQYTPPFYAKAQVKAAKTDFLVPIQDALVKEGFQVTTLSKTVDQANKIFSGVQAVLAVFGGIALIVSAIGMFNTMTVTLLERTGEIGIMRTIGASPSDIRILFLSEAMVVGFLGGIVGMAIGVGMGLIFNFFINLAANHFGGAAIQLFSFPWTFLAFIAVFSAIVGFLTGIFPARRAAALSPLEAIRYK